MKTTLNRLSRNLFCNYKIINFNRRPDRKLANSFGENFGNHNNSSRFYSNRTMVKPSNNNYIPEKYFPPKNNFENNDGKINKELISKEIKLISVQFKDPKYIQGFVKTCRSDLLNLRSVSNIQKIMDNNDKSKTIETQVLLKDEIKDVNFLTDGEGEKFLKEETLKFLKEHEIIVGEYTLKLSYNFWRVEEILSSILPDSLHDEIPTSFTIVGHIAHLNLKEEYLPYKEIIGQVILDKNPNVKTVVNKTNTIATEFRTFPMEVIAGEDGNFDVEQHELGCTFQFNFRDVYWNSRLQQEHLRLTKLYFGKAEMVFDVMAGVGPFAIPAVKMKKSFVVANDLNPASYKYLMKNCEINKCGDFADCYNIDGRKMIRECTSYLMDFYKKRNGILKNKIEKRVTVDSKEDKKKRKKIEVVVEKMNIPKHISHFVMNLPDSGLTFLNEYVGIYGNKEEYDEFIKEYQHEFKLPMIHVYCFEKFSHEEVPAPSIEELENRIKARIDEIMGHKFDKNNMKFHLVRNVSPTKYMFCVSFELPHELAFKK